MRITFVLAAADISGGNRVISIYAQKLVAKGHDVQVISRPRRPVTLKDKVLAIWRNLPIAKNQNVWPSHFEGVAYHRQIESYRPIVANDLPDADVLIATWWETAEWVAAMPACKGRSFYFIQHYEAHVGQNKARVDATWRLPLQKIVVANWLKDLAADCFGDGGAVLIPNAVDASQFNARPRNKQATPTVGLMYSIVPFKGCDISLAAVDLARKKVPGLKLIAFGNRPPTRQLRLPPGAEFILRPAQDQIKNIYVRCDVWLVGSRSEGFGLPILEAMACRTPVIATPTGAAPELICDGGGVLVPFEDPAAMAVEIERICGLSQVQWEVMSDVAYQKANAYSWEDALDLLERTLSV